VGEGVKIVKRVPSNDDVQQLGSMSTLKCRWRASCQG
jgi:hypothetical protein